MTDYPDEMALISLINASEKNDETLVILNTSPCNSPDTPSNQHHLTASKSACGT